MSLLDEAIREHLDLKRRRGADPTEIERLEREALGPVRRLAQEAPRGEAGADDETRIYEPGADPDHELGQAEPPLAYEEQPLSPSDGHDEHDLEDEGRYDLRHEQEGHESDHRVTEVAPAAVEPPVARADPPPSDPGHAEDLAVGHVPTGLDEEKGPETVEYDVEAEHHGEEQEDMLEETPEFLQDAPEHDRLWFEQRPPRDFDFEG